VYVCLYVCNSSVWNVNRTKSNRIFTESPIFTADTGFSRDATDGRTKEHYPVSGVLAKNTQSDHGSLLRNPKHTSEDILSPLLWAAALLRNLKQWPLAGLHVHSFPGRGSLLASSFLYNTISCHHYCFNHVGRMAFWISDNTNMKPKKQRQCTVLDHQCRQF